MSWRHLASSLLLLAASCGNYPRDPNDTLPRVKAERSFRVGLIAPVESGPSGPMVRALVGRIAQSTGATPQAEQGDTETLLKRLEAGELDLVIGRFDEKTPWSTLVTIGEPLRLEDEGETRFQTAPAVQNGENAWIALVDREVRKLTGKST